MPTLKDDIRAYSDAKLDNAAKHAGYDSADAARAAAKDAMVASDAVLGGTSAKLLVDLTADTFYGAGTNPDGSPLVVAKIDGNLVFGPIVDPETVPVDGPPVAEAPADPNAPPA